MEKTKDERINITPLLEQVLGLGEIKTKEELDNLIKALEQMPDDFLDLDRYAAFVKGLKKQKDEQPKA